MKLSFNNYAKAFILTGFGLFIYSILCFDTMYDVLYFLCTAKICIFVMYNFWIITMILLGKLFLRVFIGQLRALEFEHLYEFGRNLLTDTVIYLLLSNPTLKNQVTPTSTLIQFVCVVILSKMAHVIAHLRLSRVFETEVVRPNTIIRLMGLLMVLMIWDIVAFMVVYFKIESTSSIYLWLLFEILQNTTFNLESCIEFVFHCINYHQDGGWVSKSFYIFVINVIFDILSLCIFLVVFVLFLFQSPNHIPMHLASDIFLVGRALCAKIKAIQNYRKLLANIKEQFTEATFEELEEADTCIVCRDILYEGSCKLPCGHIFHLNCLKAWFVRQQTCPTCRLDAFSRSTSPPDLTQTQSTTAPPTTVPTDPQTPASAIPSTRNSSFERLNLTQPSRSRVVDIFRNYYHNIFSRKQNTTTSEKPSYRKQEKRARNIAKQAKIYKELAETYRTLSLECFKLALNEFKTVESGALNLDQTRRQMSTEINNDVILNPPSISWYDSPENIYVFVNFTSKQSAHEALCTLINKETDPAVYDTLQLVKNDQKAVIQLYSDVSKISVKQKSDIEYQIVLDKCAASKSWPNLTKRKYHFISVNWNHFSDKSVESTPKPAQLAQSIEMYFNLTEKDTLPITEPIELKYILSEDSDKEKHNVAMQFWNQTLTSAQKCNTLTLMWNKTSAEERKMLLKTLVGIMTVQNEKLAQEIKGGHELIEDLDNSQYTKLKITYASKWVQEFANCETSRVKILENMFLILSMHEKYIVCSTFFNYCTSCPKLLVT